MYTECCITQLNELGVLSTSYLARKYKMNRGIARQVLKAIVKDFENVKFLNRDQIYIEDCLPSFLKPKTPRKYKKSQQRYKDVTKP